MRLEMYWSCPVLGVLLEMYWSCPVLGVPLSTSWRGLVTWRGIKLTNAGAFVSC